MPSSETILSALPESPMRGETDRTSQPWTSRELARYASLAASSHNTQPWKFRIEDNAISILPDFSRRCPVVDPDDHHLFVSLGCAAENLLIAARAVGLRGYLLSDVSRNGGAIRITFEHAEPHPSLLFDAIEHRQCTRAAYDGRPAANADLNLLEDAGGTETGGLLLLTERALVENVAEYVAEGNVAQLGDAQFVDELTSWMRFNRAEAARAGDGLFGQALGIPPIPHWVGKIVMRTIVSARKQNERDVAHIRSSAGIAVFVSDADDPAHWVDAGRRYERFALEATALELRNAFINQPVEVAGLRQQFASWLGLGTRRPDLLVRFGHGPEMPRSYRRPLDDILL